jgi:hypothetical protein
MESSCLLVMLNLAAFAVHFHALNSPFQTSISVKLRREPGLRTVGYDHCGYGRDHGYGDAMLEFETGFRLS